MGRLSAKRVVVTGASSGIGRASAALFAREGASVVAFDVTGGVVSVVEAINDAGGAAHAIVGDVSDPATVESLIAECVDRFGGLDGVYANAGIVGGIAPVLALELDDWRRVLDVNLLGAFLCIKHGAARMIDHGGGAIVCTASVAGLRAGAGPAHYSASKAAIINLVQSTAFQLSGTGVRINAVCPGLIETGMTQPIFELARDAGKLDRIGQLNPTKRAGQPGEIANAALFLLSDDSSYLNGHAMVVDGGLSASHPFVPGRMM